MNQDTIPSQLGPVTIPSSLGPVGPSVGNSESSSSPLLKWVLAAALVAGLFYFAR